MIIFSENEIFRRAIVASIKKAIEACAPGVACTTIEKVSQDVFKKGRYNDFLYGSELSRGLVNRYERRLDCSNLREYNDRPLRDNMVLSVEPYAIAPNVGAQRHCDMVHEVLSTVSNGCLIIN